MADLDFTTAVEQALAAQGVFDWHGGGRAVITWKPSFWARHEKRKCSHLGRSDGEQGQMIMILIRQSSLWHAQAVAASKRDQTLSS